MFDTSSFGKLLVQGRDAAAVLQRVSAGDVAAEPGRIVLHPVAQLPRLSIEADVTVTPAGRDQVLVLSGPATLGRDRDWLERHIGADEFATVTDISQALAMIPVMGAERPAAPAVHHRRRPVGRGLPVRHITGNRPRLRLRPRHPHHLRRRARLGAAHPGRPGRARLRHDRRGRPGARAAPAVATTPWIRSGWKRPTGAGATTSPPGTPAGSRPGLRRGLGQARRFHRPRRPAPAEGGRRPAPAGPVRPAGPGRLRLPRRAGLPRRRPWSTG